MKQSLRLALCFCTFILYGHASFCQETFPRNDVKDKRSETFAFVNAVIHINPDQTIDKGTMLIKEGIIENVGPNVTVPKGYQRLDLDGKHLYPSLIDIYTNYGMPKVERAKGGC